MIVLNQNFEILNWQRIKRGDVKILKVEYENWTKENQIKIDKIKEFIDLFQLDIDHLQIQFKQIYPQGILAKDVINVIKNDIYPKYADQITQLTIINLTQSVTNKQQEKNKKDMLLDILLPLKNLKYVSIQHDYNKFQLERGNCLHEILDVFIQNDQFNSIEYLSIMQDNSEFEDESLRTKKNEMMLFQNKLIERILKLKSLKELQIGILNMNFNQEFYKNAYSNISEMKNLQQIGIDLWSKNCSLKQQISNLKQLTKFGKSLKEIAFLSDNYCKASDALQLKEALLEFEKIEDLCIKGIKFQQKVQLDQFLSYFSCYQNLKIITLDLSDTDYKKEDLKKLICKSLKDCNQIEELNLKYPNDQHFDIEDYQDFQNLLISKENTLKNLFLQVDCENKKEGIEMFKTIINLKNLLIFKFNVGDTTIFDFDSQKDKVENVRKIKTFTIEKHFEFFDQVQWVLLFQLKELINLKFSWALNKELQFSDDDIINHLKQFRLESLNFYHNIYWEDSKYLDLKTKIINMHKPTLKYLDYQLFKQIEILPNVVFFKTQERNLSYQLFGTILQKFPSLVELNTLDYYYSITIKLYRQKYYENLAKGHEIYKQELEILNFNYYITTVKSEQPVYSQCFSEYLLKKRAMLAHLVIYCQIVKPFISYQADCLHWDLSIDF